LCMKPAPSAIDRQRMMWLKAQYALQAARLKRFRSCLNQYLEAFFVTEYAPADHRTKLLDLPIYKHVLKKYFEMAIDGRRSHSTLLFSDGAARQSSNIPSEVRQMVTEAYMTMQSSKKKVKKVPKQDRSPKP